MVSLGLFFGVLILVLSQIYVWNKLFDYKFNFKNVFLYIYILFLTFFVMFTHLYINSFLRIILVIIIFICCNWLFYKKNVKEIAFGTIYTQFILCLCDFISALLLILFMRIDTNFVRNNFFDTFFANFIVSVVYIFVCNFTFLWKIFYKLKSFINKINFKNIILISLLVIVSINFMMAITYYKLNSIYVICINVSLLIVYSFIIYRAMNEKNINIMIKAENKSLMESLNEYENMVDRQRVDNHENKNQLLIIKNMIKKNDKDVVKYIDTIVKDEKKDDEALYTRVKTIPTGGLQGIIYQKMLTMKDEKILFSLDVSRDVRKIDLSNFSMENNYKLCKIVGVILDNAIEECRNIEEKIIMISLYIDEGMFIIDISNRFGGIVDVDKIDNEGYTTKGNGHGYGLSLVKKIVDDSNGIFINERRVKNNIFKQIVKVKI